MATLPPNIILSILSVSGAAKTVTAVSNAAEAVLSCTAHGFVVGDVLQWYSPAWETTNRRVIKVKAVTTDTFTAEGVDTTNAELFPAGFGAGTVRKLSDFLPLGKTVGYNPSGGDPKEVSVRYQGSKSETIFNDGASAVKEVLDMDEGEYGSPAFLALRALSASGADTVFRKTLRAGVNVYTPCTVFLNENLRASNSVMAYPVAIYANGPTSRY